MNGPLSLRVRASMLVRSFAVQGSFNYRTLNGTGFAWVLLPALRGIRPEPDQLDEAVRRHQEPFNSHPYLVGIAVGAVARMEQDRASTVVIERFKGALRGPLGALGDVLFWAGIRPTCVLGALILLALGAPPWVTVLAFLLPYNIAHLAARVWGFRLGLRHGSALASGLRGAPLARLALAAQRSAAFLLGVLLPILAIGGLTGTTAPSIAAVVLVGAGLGIVRGSAIRGPALAGLALLIAFGLVRGTLA